MFTGIVNGFCPITNLIKQNGLTTLTINFTSLGTEGLAQGASVSINGVCLTVVAIENHHVTFNIIQETLGLTNLAHQQINDLVNIERSATFASEIGGHILSGHVHGTTSIHHIKRLPNNVIVCMAIPHFLKDYLFPKGFIALNGSSLTVVDVNHDTSTFTVHLIPETLARTTWGIAKAGDLINVEIDQHTRIIVDTLHHYITNKNVISNITSETTSPPFPPKT